MKVTPLALITIFAATSSAFGLNGAAQSVLKSTTQSVGGFAKKSPAMVQPVDIQGNRLNSLVSAINQINPSVFLSMAKSVSVISKRERET